MREERSDLPLHAEHVGEIPKRPQREFVLQSIADHSACNSMADFSPHTVTMMKVVKGTASLLVAEEIIQLEFCNVCVPLKSQR